MRKIISLIVASSFISLLSIAQVEIKQAGSFIMFKPANKASQASEVVFVNKKEIVSISIEREKETPTNDVVPARRDSLMKQYEAQPKQIAVIKVTTTASNDTRMQRPIGPGSMNLQNQMKSLKFVIKEEDINKYQEMLLQILSSGSN